MNFMFESVLTREILFLLREHKIQIFGLTCNVVLLYRHTDDSVSDDFPKIYEHFPKARRTFPNIFRKFPEIAEDCWRLSRKTRICFDHTPTNLRTI